MMSFVNNARTTIRTAGTKTTIKLNAMRDQRVKLFSKFPVGSDAVWLGMPRGKVLRHDHDLGRIVTTDGGSFNPEEMTEVVKEETKKQ